MKNVVIAAASSLMLFSCQTYHPINSNINEQLDKWQSNQLLSAEQVNKVEVINLQTAQLLALQYNPKFKIQAKRLVVGTSIELEFAGLWDDLELGFEPSKYLSSSEKSWALASNVSLNIPINGAKRLEKQLAKKRQHQAILELQLLKNDLLLQLNELWYNYAQTDEQIVIQKAFIEKLSQANNKIKKLALDGEYDQTDASFINISFIESEQDLIRLEREKEQLYYQLIALIGFHPESKISFDLKKTNNTFELPDSWYTAIINNNPKVLLANSTFALQDQQYKLEIRKQFPNLNISTGYSDDVGERTMPLGISLSLPLWNRNKLAVAIAKNEREITNQEIIINAAEALSALKVQLIALKSIDEQLSTVNNILIPNQNDVLNKISKRITLGEANLIMFTDVLDRKLRSEIQGIKLHYERKKVIDQINILMGKNEVNDEK